MLCPPFDVCLHALWEYLQPARLSGGTTAAHVQNNMQLTVVPAKTNNSHMTARLMAHAHPMHVLLACYCVTLDNRTLSMWRNSCVFHTAAALQGRKGLGISNQTGKLANLTNTVTCSVLVI